MNHGLGVTKVENNFSQPSNLKKNVDTINKYQRKMCSGIVIGSTCCSAGAEAKFDGVFDLVLNNSYG